MGRRANRKHKLTVEFRTAEDLAAYISLHNYLRVTNSLQLSLPNFAAAMLVRGANNILREIQEREVEDAKKKMEANTLGESLSIDPNIVREKAE